jgi:hypothetical protein
MTTSYTSIQVNPFADDVVREPREVSFSVKGLNDGPLNALIERFAALDTALLSNQPAKAAKAQLVVSPDRGYGKSHLLGRLFATLGQRATKIYLRPFQDPYKAWHSILLLTIQELERPDNEKIGAPTQLEALAVGTLAHVAADFIAEGGIPDYPEAVQAVAFLRKVDADSNLRAAKIHPWIEWLATLIADPGQAGRLVLHLRRRGIDLLGREKAWLKVLAGHWLDEPYGERRSAAAKWLRAEPLEPDEVALLRLDESDNEGKGDSPPQEINDLSFHRLQGLCLLATYYRPFVFCFDQTEFYASDPALIKTLGNCIDQLHADLRNHLTVITANQANWQAEVLPHLAAPHCDRIDAQLPLEGIRLEGARELIVERLRDYDLDAEDTIRFFGDGWLEKVFNPLPELGVRVILMKAAERFRMLAAPGKPQPRPHTLDDLFRLEVNDVRSKSALIAYNQDSCMWFVKDVGRGLDGVSIERPLNRRYFSLEWIWSDRRVCFAFEGGDHWKRWGSIADEVLALSRERGGRQFLSYVFRTPDLKKIPRPSWVAAKPKLDAANQNGFRIIDLTLEEVCEVHAARELYSNALQGNISYSGDETLVWLQKHFAPFLKNLASRHLSTPEKREDGGTNATSVASNIERKLPQQPIELDAQKLQLVLDMVREQRIVDISSVLVGLGGENLRDSLLRSVEAHPNLKAHPGPKTIFLQWRITA